MEPGRSEKRQQSPERLQGPGCQPAELEVSGRNRPVDEAAEECIGVVEDSSDVEVRLDVGEVVGDRLGLEELEQFSGREHGNPAEKNQRRECDEHDREGCGSGPRADVVVHAPVERPHGVVHEETENDGPNELPCHEGQQGDQRQRHEPEGEALAIELHSFQYGDSIVAHRWVNPIPLW